MNRPSSARILLAATVVTASVIAGVLAGPAGSIYFIILVVATTAGWPLGIALFGSHPVAIITGSTVGYGLTSLAFWAGMSTHSLLVGDLVWIAVAIAGWLAVRGRRAPAIALPGWDVSTSWSLGAALALTILLVVPPF